MTIFRHFLALGITVVATLPLALVVALVHLANWVHPDSDAR
jgi:hypothetical protein